MERKESFHAKPATEVDSDALVIDHHVHASVVAIAGSRLALTIQYLAAHVFDIGNKLFDDSLYVGYHVLMRLVRLRELRGECHAASLVLR